MKSFPHVLLYFILSTHLFIHQLIYNFIYQWLVEQANCMFIGVNDGYIDFVDNRLLYAIDTKIHHVEKWGPFAENIRGPYSFSNDVIDESEYRKKIVNWGTNAVEYANWKWKNT